MPANSGGQEPRKSDQDTASDIKIRAQEVVSSVSGKAQELAGDVARKASDAASAVGHKAKETAAAAVDKTDGAISAVGHQLTALAGTVRKNATPEGALGSAATTVADNLQAGGRYLEEHSLDDMGKDATALIRQHPIPTVLIGFGVGCILGMALSRR
jgi:ElaB/YqjD/DUF883 family membrane-anchored ribosome-binding protein